MTWNSGVVLFVVSTVWTVAAWSADAQAGGAGGTNAATVAKPAATQVIVPLTLKQKLDAIILPEIALRDAALTNVIDFLVEASRKYDRSLPEDRRGVNIVLNVAPADKGRTVTMSARSMSVGSALTMVCRLAGVHCEVGDAAVMVLPGGEGPTMIVKAYLVNQAFLSGIREAGAQAYFTKMGVRFPKGSSVTYNAGLGKIVLVNTAENIRTMDTLVAGMGGRVAP
jgi:hypothetical protein